MERHKPETENLDRPVIIQNNPPLLGQEAEPARAEGGHAQPASQRQQPVSSRSASSDHMQDDRLILSGEVLLSFAKDNRIHKTNFSRTTNDLMSYSSSLKWEEHLESQIKRSLYDKLSVSAAAFVETKNDELGDVRFDDKHFIMAWGNDKFKLRALSNQQDFVDEFSGEKYNLNELITEFIIDRKSTVSHFLVDYGS